MSSKYRVVQLAAFVIIASSSCGRPTLRSLEKWQVTVEESGPGDGGGIAMVVHRDDCPADRTRITAPAGAAADCLRGHAVGSHFEIVRAIYKHPPMSCGVKGDMPRNTVGGCPVENVGMMPIGTPCPKPGP